MKKYTKLAVYSVLYVFTFAIAISSFILKPHPVDNQAVTVVRIIIICFATVLLTKYTIYMLLCPIYQIVSVKEKELLHIFVKNYKPLVTVMIPAFNEEVGLLATVKTVLQNSYKNIEIIVVNDGSTDKSDSIMRNFIKKYDREFAGLKEKIPIIYCYKENGGKGSCLNKAIELSHGEIIISIDADCVVEQRAIEYFVNVFRDPRVMASVGNVRIGNKNTLIGTIQRLEFLFSFYFKKADSLLGSIYIIGGAAGAYRREVFTKLGGYSLTNITEDIELSVRIQNAGWKIVYCPEAIIETEGASSLKDLIKQRTRWKRGRFSTFWQYRKMFFSLQPKHNKILTWFVLPLAAFGDLQLSLEPLFLLVLYIFSFLTNDFTAFMSGVFVVALMFAIQAYDSKGEDILYILLSPIGWLLFYVATFVEVAALVKSIILIVKKQELRWQKWQRNGVLDS